MKYDFDTEISRAGTGASKWEMINRGRGEARWEVTDACFGEERILPLWVADMDFPSPQPVIEALVRRAQHGIFGYTHKTEAYYQAVVDWMRRRQGWEIAPEWILTTPGVVTALNLLVGTFVGPGEKVVIQPPVYYPFFSAVTGNDAQVATNALVYDGRSYTMDWAGLEEQVRDPQVKMLILCSPHNPVGRVWSREELERLGRLCLENGVLVVSDEIHGDLIYQGVQFTPFGSLGGGLGESAIICTAPSKTFNVAGLQTSNIIIPDADLRCRFEATLRRVGLHGINIFGMEALQAAYHQGEEWLEQVMDYIQGNLRYLEDYVARHMPRIKVVPPEGTYLVWLDCRGLGLDKWEQKALFLEEARVFLDDGFIFGRAGEGFQRINIACPRPLLAEALARMGEALARRGLAEG